VADIPAANITLQERLTLGNKLLWTAKVKGDGTGVTIPVPLGKVQKWWTKNIDDTSAIPAITGATNILTYASAPTSNKSHNLFVIGTD
jgi:hypothetical protein